MSNRPLLALDIGTRKVVGLLTTQGPKGLKIIAAQRLEHANRAMFDGQIHDVAEVAAVVGKIVAKLSAKAGTELREATVAAAGRALRTYKGTAARESAGLLELTHDQVFALELEAVQVAQRNMAAALSDLGEPVDFHYVGHSEIQSRLDGLPISNLVGQRGRLAELDVIATFLPRGVVDSLQAVLARNDLEMTALTLEPIAAINVAVPPSMRHINLVLVDIGAGTSDIAITSKGSVIAYDMVPIAGDEITEALCETYLLDFNVGEAVKRKISGSNQVTFTNVLGQQQSVSTSQLIESLGPSVMRLAALIAGRVQRLNGGPPQGVMMVGGGSLTPGLPSALAQALGLPEDRVAVRGREAIIGVEGARTALKGPDAVTPIGIAVSSRDKSTFSFHLVYVNGEGVRLFHPSRSTVADALLGLGIAISDLQGKVGKGLTISVNGTLQMIRGTFGRPARILMGEEPVTLETPITHGDQIQFTAGVQGANGKATVAEVAPMVSERLAVTLNGCDLLLPPLITVNGNPCDSDRQLQDNDAVVVRLLRTVEDLLLHQGYEDPGGIDRIRFTFDGMPQMRVHPRYKVRLRGMPVTVEAPLTTNDVVEVEPNPPLTLGDLIATMEPNLACLRVAVNGQVMEFQAKPLAFKRNGRPASPTDLICENDEITRVVQRETPIFAQLLAQAGVETNPPPGKKRLLMQLNGSPAEFVTPLKDGDSAELIWE